MLTKPLVFGLLAAGCVTAAAGGAYVAVRQSAADSHVTGTEAVLTAPVAPPEAAASPVAETEAVLEPTAPEPVPVRNTPAPAVRAELAPPRPARRAEAPAPPPVRRAAAPPKRGSVAEPAPIEREPLPAPAMPQPAALEVPIEPPPVPAIPEREFVEVVVPASAVIGLQVDTSLSSERSRVEDRVEARVTRDVTADGRIAIPAGSRVLGAVTMVERGGKLKERARLGVRFHTLVLANGLELPIRTETIVREGESPGNESARKIGGAAAGGAILGAILGGGKGAVIGGATGAAGGTAVVMAGDRNAATLPAGTVLTVRLTSPVSVDVEKR